MKLEDLFSVVSDNTEIRVYSFDDDLLYCYDGKNSIDEFYNEIEIFCIDVYSADVLRVWLYC